MNSLVVYESQFGNTEKIANKIAEGLSAFGAARAMTVGDVTADALAEVDVLVVGCPTQAWSAMPATKAFLGHLTPEVAGRVWFAEFDTRLDKPRWLTGSAANSLEKEVKHLKGRNLTPCESFKVEGTEGPLAEGELERAASWASTLHAQFELQAKRVPA